jgi:hypothetical protein
MDLEEADYLQVLQHINEFLPVKELAGRPLDLRVLQQFGLVDNEKIDLFLVAAFAQAGGAAESSQKESAKKRSVPVPQAPRSDQPDRIE